MLDFHAASDRAVRHAIHTGDMPNMYLIHALQRSEGYDPCFARATTHCIQTHCRWHHTCMELYEFDETGRSRGLHTNEAPGESRSVSLSVLGLEAVSPESGKPEIPVRPARVDTTTTAGR